MDTVVLKLTLATAVLDKMEVKSTEDALEAAKELYGWVMEGAILTDEEGKPTHLRPVQ